MQFKRIKCQSNNVRFNPPTSGVWYRSYDDDCERYLHSDLKLKDCHISLSYFTSDSGDGYSCCLYRNGKLTHWRELQSGNHIKAKTISSAEKQALDWFQNIEKI